MCFWFEAAPRRFRSVQSDGGSGIKIAPAGYQGKRLYKENKR